MRVLVTGGAGYIGSHAAKALAKAGHVPVVLDDLRTGHRHNVRWGPLEHGDVRDAAHVAEVLLRQRIEAVLHFAALSSVAEAGRDPERYHDVNVGGTIAIVRAMRACGVGRIVFSSTAATYGGSGSQCAGRRLTEDDRQEPANAYGQSKLAAERLLTDCCAAWGLGAVALRYFNAAGADPDGELGEEHDPETHLVPAALLVAAGRRERLVVHGVDHATADGTCVRDFVHVGDLARAHVAALGCAEAGTFLACNLGSQRGTSVFEVIKAVEAVTGRRVPWQAAAARPGDPAHLVADASRAARVLGFVPELGLEAIIETAWRFMCGGFRAAHGRSVPTRATQREDAVA